MNSHHSRGVPLPLSQQRSATDYSINTSTDTAPPSLTDPPSYDPRARALDETGIDDLSGLYHHQGTSFLRDGHVASAPQRSRPAGHHPATHSQPRNYPPPRQQSPRLYQPHQYPSREYSAPQYPGAPRQYTPPQYPSTRYPPSYHTTPSHAYPPPSPPPPRGSSLHSPQPRLYTYVRGQEYAEEYETHSWHDSDTPTRTEFQEYRDEERPGGPPNGMDLERAFPVPHGSQYGYRGQPVYAYAGHRADGRPLINYVTNEWKQRPGRPTTYSHQQRYEYIDPDETWCDDCEDICRSRLCRRYICLFIIILVVLIYTWTHWLGPDLGEKARLKSSVRDAQGGSKAYFGIHQQMVFPGTRQLAQLDRANVPGSGVRQDGQDGRQGTRRLIIVGDIHGCVEELQALLGKLSFNPMTDHLMTTGDMIARGPRSIDVVALLMKHNASCVRGNHEDRVLLAHRDLQAPSHRKAAAEGLTAEQPIKKGAKSDLELAEELSEEQVNYLLACPLVLDVGPIPGLGRLAIAHAGLVPMLPLAKQDPFSVMNMRSIDLRSFIPSRYAPPPNPYDSRGRPTGFKPDRKDKDRDRQGKSYAVAWPNLWDVAQSLSPVDERTMVVYGHDEIVGLTKGDWHFGLDAGCVGGGELAALVITGDWRGLNDVRKEVVTVPCKTYVGSTVDIPTLGGS